MSRVDSLGVPVICSEEPATQAPYTPSRTIFREFAEAPGIHEISPNLRERQDFGTRAPARAGFVGISAAGGSDSGDGD